MYLYFDFIRLKAAIILATVRDFWTIPTEEKYFIASGDIKTLNAGVGKKEINEQ